MYRSLDKMHETAPHGPLRTLRTLTESRSATGASD
jgi:hypothetical protein